MAKCIIQLLTAGPGCSKCQRGKEKINKIIEKYEDKVKIEEVDITQHPEKVREYNIFSTPGIVVNGELIGEGTVDEEKLRRKIEECL